MERRRRASAALRCDFETMAKAERSRALRLIEMRRRISGESETMLSECERGEVGRMKEGEVDREEKCLSSERTPFRRVRGCIDGKARLQGG